MKALNQLSFVLYSNLIPQRGRASFEYSNDHKLPQLRRRQHSFVFVPCTHFPPCREGERAHEQQHGHSRETMASANRTLIMRVI